MGGFLVGLQPRRSHLKQWDYVQSRGLLLLPLFVFRFCFAMASFVEEFFRSPSTIGSLIPSSRELSDRIVEPIDFATAGCIVEYGPGTGAFTEVLLRRRRPETVLLLVEINSSFSGLLKERYADQPNVHIVHGSADKTREYLAGIGVAKADYVVCGLPFSSLPRRLGWRILQHTQQLLQPTGKLILFQYSLQNQRLFARFFRLLHHTHVLLNLPPAYVLTYAPESVALSNKLAA